MADEDITLDGKPLHSLRVADLKTALEQRKLPKSGPKNALIKRLKGALMLENLQKTSASHSGLQPNSQIGEEMSQNSFIKQYLATQQELLRQKLEREAQQAAETDESSATEEKEEHSDRNDEASFTPDMRSHSAVPQPVMMARPESGGHRGPRTGLQEAPEGARPLWSARRQPEPSPPRAVASLSVRVLGRPDHQPDRQGPPLLPAVPQRAHDKDGAVPGEPGAAHSVLHLSRSAAAAAAMGCGRDDSDDGDDDEESEEESDEEEEWGAQVRSGRAPAQLRPQQQQQQQPPPPPPPQQQARASAAPTASRSRRKLQPPQHIPPPQAHPPPMQLRHPTPPPSPPPELSFPLPDTPKQSPPNAEEAGGSGGESPGAPGGGRRRPPPQRQDEEDDSDSSARSSSPEPARRWGGGALARLAHKMDAEKGGPAASGEPEAVDMSVGAARRSSAPSSSSSTTTTTSPAAAAAAAAAATAAGPATVTPGRPAGGERGSRRPAEEEKMEVEATGRAEEEQTIARPGEVQDKAGGVESERHLPPWKRGRAGASVAPTPSTGREEEAAPKTGPAHSEPAPAREPLSKAPANTPSSATANRPRASAGIAAAVTVRDSGSSSDSDSGSDSPSSQSSASSREKPRPAKLAKNAGPGRGVDPEEMATRADVEAAAAPLPLPPPPPPPHQKADREVSESSEAPAKEAEPDTQSAMAQEPASEAKPVNGGGGLEESTTPKAFAARKISLTSSKTSPPSGADGAGAGTDPEAGAAAGRKRRWGSSTAVTAKKPSISITTDSLKSLIPDIKVSQEAVVDLHPEELQLSGEEESQGMDNGRADHDLGLKIRRTVTQVVPGDGQENGQGRDLPPPPLQSQQQQQQHQQQEEEEEEEEEEPPEKEEQRRASRERRRSSTRGDDPGQQRHSPARLEAEAQKVTPSDSVVRRSISQQKSGMSVTIDDAGVAPPPRQPSPPRGKLSAIVHVSNLVRPFTLGQLKDLLKRTGSVLEEGFWIDKIKSHCYVTYATTVEAQATRAALHGLKWPPSNPKVLSVDFSQQEELDFHRGTLKVERAPAEKPGPPPGAAPARLPPLMPERDRERDRDKGRDRGGAMREQWAEHGPMGVAMRDPWAERGGGGGPLGGGGVRDQWAEREREMQRREQARCEREWDRDKIREFGHPGEEARRSRSRERERRRRERAKSKERKGDKKDEPPAKLLDDLFLKTKAAPCIYWLPLTEEQVKKRKQLDQEEHKRKEAERKERLKAREAGGPAGGGAGGGGGGRATSGARRADAAPEREGDRNRDGFRPRGPSGGTAGGAAAAAAAATGATGTAATAGGRRSRSRSNPRGRRR